jgi:RNA polymerase sigma-70 factor (ECF subfamily)
VLNNPLPGSRNPVAPIPEPRDRTSGSGAEHPQPPATANAVETGANTDRPGSHFADFTAYVLPELAALGRMARSLTLQPADAEDLLQEVLLRAFLAIGRFDGRHPRAWLLTIMRNAAHSQRRRRIPYILDQYEINDLPDQSTEPSAEQAVLDETLTAELRNALRALPEMHQQTVFLVDIQGFNYADAASALGIPVGTLTSRLHRARSQIRLLLESLSGE